MSRHRRWLAAATSAIVIGLGSPLPLSIFQPESASAAQVCSDELRGSLIPLSDPDETAGHAVLLVHGWLSTAVDRRADTGARNAIPDSPFSRDVKWEDGGGGAASDPRSVEDRLDALDDTVVYAFDYSRAASLWVGDSGVSARLAEAIECLAGETGARVDVVAHSMGGLALRAAFDADPSLQDHIDTVVTIGTPNLGSDASILLDGLSLFGNTLLPQATSLAKLALPLFVEECNRELEEDARSGCDIIPIIRTGAANAGTGGQALRRGSTQLESLAPWPDDVRLSAIAGNTAIRIRAGDAATALPSVLNTAARITRMPLPAVLDQTVSLGDGLVAEESALDGADRSFVARCDVEVDASSIFGVRDTLQGFAAGRGVALPAGPCAHDTLFQSLEVVDRIAAEVAGSGRRG